MSSFLRNFRDGGDFSPPPSPPREDPPGGAAASWYVRGGLLHRGVEGLRGAGAGGEEVPATTATKSTDEGLGKEMSRQCSSIRLLRETMDVKLTKTALNGLQQDFAVQVCGSPLPPSSVFCVSHAPPFHRW